MAEERRSSHRRKIALPVATYSVLAGAALSGGIAVVIGSSATPPSHPAVALMSTEFALIPQSPAPANTSDDQLWLLDHDAKASATVSAAIKAAAVPKCGPSSAQGGG